MLGFEFGVYLWKKKMGKVKAWGMAMEELAEEAILAGMGKTEGVEYMINNLEEKYPAYKDELERIFQETLNRAKVLGISIPSAGPI